MPKPNSNTPSTYVGSARQVEREGREPFLSVEVDLTELKQHMTDDHIRVWKGKDGTEHRCINIIVAPMKAENVTKYKTHSVKLVEAWKPDSKPEPKAQQPNLPNNDSVPF